ncbi:hypothetical protein FB451DRAFT_1378624 [Mycena latifolia]|nr:hypothetical protein FB451DRAFT_1378624 [Mycena latifolia]
MENNLGTEYEGSLFTPPASPTPTSAPSLPSPTVEGHASIEDLLDNWDTVLGDDGMVTFVAKAAVDTAPALSPPISGSQSAVAKPLARTWAATAPNQVASQWQAYSIPNCYLDSVQEPPYQHSFAPAGLPPLPVWPGMDPASSASEYQAVSRRVPRSILQASAGAPMGMLVDASRIHKDVSSQAVGVAPPQPFRRHGVKNTAYWYPSQMGPYAHALPPCGTTSGLFDAYPTSALTAAPTTTAMVAHATAPDAAYGGQFTHYSHYPAQPQAPWGIYGTHSTQVTRPCRESVEEPQSSAFGRSQDAHGQLPAYGNYPSNMIWPWPPIPESAASHSWQPTASQVQRFIPAPQQFALPPSSAPQYTETAPSSWARAHVPGRSGNATQMPPASSSHVLLAGSSTHLSGWQPHTDIKAPTISAGYTTASASTSGVTPGLTATSTTPPAPAALPQTPPGKLSVQQILDISLPEHRNKTYTCKVTTKADGTPLSCGKYSIEGSRDNLQRHLAERHGFPSAAEAEECKAHNREIKVIACVWNTAKGERPCHKAVPLNKMGAHIACHLKSHWFRCAYCDDLFSTKAKYVEHFARCDGYLAYLKAPEGPPPKRRRVDEAGDGDAERGQPISTCLIPSALVLNPKDVSGLLDFTTLVLKLMRGSSRELFTCFVRGDLTTDYDSSTWLFEFKRVDGVPGARRSMIKIGDEVAHPRLTERSCANIHLEVTTNKSGIALFRQRDETGSHVERRGEVASARILVLFLNFI